MTARRLLVWAIAGIAAVLLTGARRPVPDQMWAHPQIARFRIHDVGILPVATFDGDWTHSAVVEEFWIRHFFDTQHFWMPSVMIRLKMAAASKLRDSLDRAVSSQILKTGRVDSVTASGLCRSVGVGTLLCLRVDRCESAVIELSAALVDSTGAMLWRISGRELWEEYVGAPAKEGVRMTQGHPPTMTSRVVTIGGRQVTIYQIGQGVGGAVLGRPGEGPGVAVTDAHARVPMEIMQALDRLLARWVQVFPGSSSR